MGRHSSGRTARGRGGSHLLSTRLLLAVPICLCMGVFALWWGISLVANPETCNLQAMTSADLCKPGSRGSETLVRSSELDYPAGYYAGYRSLNEQVSHNKRFLFVYISSGLFFVGISLWLGFQQLVLFLERRIH